MRNEGKRRRARAAPRYRGFFQRGTLAICAVLCIMTGPPLREAVAAPGTTVILVLGDSFTAGLGVPRWAAFPAQLEARLRAQGGPFASPTREYRATLPPVASPVWTGPLPKTPTWSS